MNFFYFMKQKQKKNTHTRKNSNKGHSFIFYSVRTFRNLYLPTLYNECTIKEKMKCILQKMSNYIHKVMAPLKFGSQRMIKILVRFCFFVCFLLSSLFSFYTKVFIFRFFQHLLMLFNLFWFFFFTFWFLLLPFRKLRGF